jgi:hypothetical protein
MSKINTHFLSHGVVDIFRCYEPAGTDVIQLMQFWFATSQNQADFSKCFTQGTKQFDIRDLSPDASEWDTTGGMQVQRLAADDDLKDIVIRAIDEGVLTTRGVVTRRRRYAVPVIFRGQDSFLVEDARTPEEAQRLAEGLFRDGREPYEGGTSWQEIEEVGTPEEV